MSKTRKHKKRWELKQETEDWFCLDRYFEINTPSKSFKNTYRKSHKAKIKQAIKNKAFNNIPTFKNCHKENWYLEW